MIEDKEFFENGGFSPEWATDAPAVEPPQVKTEVQFKDRETLLEELRDIKERIHEIRAREWQLAKMLEFHNHRLASE